MTMEISNVICQNVNTMEIYNVILGKSSSFEWNGNQQREDTFISSKDANKKTDNEKTTKQSLQSKDSHCLKKNKLEFIIVFIYPCLPPYQL